MHKWAGVGIGRARTAGKDGYFTACHRQVATAQIRYATIRVYHLLADDVIDKRFEVRADAVGTRRSRTRAQEKLEH